MNSSIEKPFVNQIPGLKYLHSSCQVIVYPRFVIGSRRRTPRSYVFFIDNKVICKFKLGCVRVCQVLGHAVLLRRGTAYCIRESLGKAIGNQH
jgi:hypothetical protein